MVRRNNAYTGERPDFQMLPVIRLYDLRHSLATNLIMDETIPDKIVSEIDGTSVKNSAVPLFSCKKRNTGVTLWQNTRLRFFNVWIILGFKKIQDLDCTTLRKT